MTTNSATLLPMPGREFRIPEPRVAERTSVTQVPAFPPDIIENHTFDEISIADSACLTRTLTAEDIQLFATMSGDVNPAHLDPEYANATQFRGIIGHGMWGGALISTVLGTDYPGPGTIYLSQNLSFLKPVRVGDTIEVRVTVAAKDERNRRVTLDCVCTNQNGAQVITGSAVVMAPREKVRRARPATLQVRLTDKTLRYRQLLSAAKDMPTISVAVVYPCSPDALRGALEAAAIQLITPVLVGPEATIRAVAATADIALGNCRIVDVPDAHAAAKTAVAMASAGEVQALMKGSLHTDELMGAVVKASGGLRTGRRISHVYALDVPSYPKPLLISDGAINVEPDLDAKADIVRNAVELAHAIGIAVPRVAILAAVETVNPHMQSTLDAAALCKMADRGQIEGAILDGPLAFDNAISAVAAKEKGINSPVSGQADILIAPNLEAGNMMAKQLQYLADAQVAGLVLGARVPVILTSRADTAIARIASCALAVLVVRARTAAGES